MLRLYGLVIVISLCMIGCVSSSFSPLDSQYIGLKNEFVVKIPENWKKYKPVKDSSLVITRDGLELQQIFISMKTTESNLEYTKRKANESMMSQELAELFIDNLKSDEKLMNLEILDNIPSVINGQNGFKFVYKFKTKDGLKKKGIMCGFNKGKRIFTLDYVAPEQVYFEKDIRKFENICETFKVK